MYAVLDIETTGGKFNEEGITEIAIYRFDGREVVDQFISLVNPEQPIQPFVVQLTGINNKMLRNAPKFYEVAKRIIEITNECTIVAHNAPFDYRILRLEFDRLGYDYQRKSLCTVDLSKELLPEEESHSLGKLARSLGIPMTDRHRASGDALATVKLFKLLLNRDTKKKIIQQSVNLNVPKKMETKLRDLLETVPSTTGVFYLHNAKGKIIFIGRSRNMKKRLNQYFTNENKKSRQIQERTAAVSVEETGSELIATLKEYEELKQNRPYYNTLKREQFTSQLVIKIDPDGFASLVVERPDDRPDPIAYFANSSSAKKHLLDYVDKYDLCLNRTSMKKDKGACENYKLGTCKGACVGNEEPSSYNARVEDLIREHSFFGRDLAIIDRGRNAKERAVILIENGKLRGMGYFNLNFQINDPQILHKIITPMKDNAVFRFIIQRHLRSKKVLKIIDLKAINQSETKN
ncbi:MAG: exonuclease domain-containing protein [Leeuwenhoekiella sp.]